MKKGNVVHIHSGVFFRHNENNVICLKKMDGTRDYCIESTKPLSQRQMPHTLSHGSLGLKKGNNKFKKSGRGKQEAG